MKFTMSGFSQQAALEFGLDTTDLYILRWIVDFMESGRMRAMFLDGEKYYWVSYQGIVDDMPLLYIKKDAVYKRLRHICDLKILKKKTVCAGGKFSYYALGEKFEELLRFETLNSQSDKNKSDLNQDPHNQNLSINNLNQNLDDENTYSNDLNHDLCDTIDNPCDLNNDIHYENIYDSDLDRDPHYLSQDLHDENKSYHCHSQNSFEYSSNHSSFNQNQIDYSQNQTDHNIEQITHKLYKSIKLNKRDDISLYLSELLLSYILKAYPNFKKPNMSSWIRGFEKILYSDYRDPEEVADLIKWIHTKNSFWCYQILNPNSLRTHYDKMMIQKLSENRSEDYSGWTTI